MPSSRQNRRRVAARLRKRHIASSTARRAFAISSNLSSSSSPSVPPRPRSLAQPRCCRHHHCVAPAWRKHHAWLLQQQRLACLEGATIAAAAATGSSIGSGGTAFAALPLPQSAAHLNPVLKDGKAAARSIVVKLFQWPSPPPHCRLCLQLMLLAQRHCHSQPAVDSSAAAPARDVVKEGRCAAQRSPKAHRSIFPRR